MTKQEQAEQLRLRARALRTQAEQTASEGARRVIWDRAEDLDAEARVVWAQSRRKLVDDRKAVCEPECSRRSYKPSARAAGCPGGS